MICQYKNVTIEFKCTEIVGAPVTVLCMIQGSFIHGYHVCWWYLTPSLLLSCTGRESCNKCCIIKAGRISASEILIRALHFQQEQRSSVFRQSNFLPYFYEPMLHFLKVIFHLKSKNHPEINKELIQNLLGLKYMSSKVDLKEIPLIPRY